MATKKTTVKATVKATDIATDIATVAPKDVAPEAVPEVAAKPIKATRTYVGVEDFIRAYKAGEKWEDVARMLGQSVVTIKQRVYAYKKKGINIEAKPGKGRGTAKLDVEKINKMLAAE